LIDYQNTTEGPKNTVEDTRNIKDHKYRTIKPNSQIMSVHLNL
jgi:hypothetical protein